MIMFLYIKIKLKQYAFEKFLMSNEDMLVVCALSLHQWDEFA